MTRGIRWSRIIERLSPGRRAIGNVSKSQQRPRLFLPRLLPRSMPRLLPRLLPQALSPERWMGGADLDPRLQQPWSGRDLGRRMNAQQQRMKVEAPGNDEMNRTDEQVRRRHQRCRGQIPAPVPQPDREAAEAAKGKRCDALGGRSNAWAQGVLALARTQRESKHGALAGWAGWAGSATPEPELVSEPPS